MERKKELETESASTYANWYVNISKFSYESGAGQCFESVVVTIWNLKEEVRNGKCCYKRERLLTKV